MSKRIPTIRPALGRGGGWIVLDKPPDRGIVAENRRRVDVGSREVGMGSQDDLGKLESALTVPPITHHSRGLDEGR